MVNVGQYHTRILWKTKITVNKLIWTRSTKQTRGGLVVFTFSVCWLKASLWSKHVHASNLGVHLSEMFKVTKKASHLNQSWMFCGFFCLLGTPKPMNGIMIHQPGDFYLVILIGWFHRFFESCQTKYSTQHSWASKHLGFGGIWIPETYIKHLLRRYLED